MSCVHTFVQIQEFSSISPPHLPENDTVLPLSASCYLPMYLHQNCIATLLEFSGSVMPVSVLCRNHEYTATYSSIVNLQMRREKK